MIWPTVEEVQAQLATVRKMATEDVDVRLQVHENGAWYIRFGDPQYDTDHRGFWGVGTIGPRTMEQELKHVAHQMLDEAKDHAGDYE